MATDDRDSDNTYLRLAHLERLAKIAGADRTLLSTQVHQLQRELNTVIAAERDRLLLDQWIQTRLHSIDQKLDAILSAIKPGEDENG